MSPITIQLPAGTTPVVSVRLKGHLDAVTGPAARADLVAHAGTGAARVVVDLSDVREMDAAGLSAIVMARRELRRHGVTLELVGAHAASVRRTLAVARFAPMFDLTEQAAS